MCVTVKRHSPAALNDNFEDKSLVTKNMTITIRLVNNDNCLKLDCNVICMVLLLLTKMFIVFYHHQLVTRYANAFLFMKKKNEISG